MPTLRVDPEHPDPEAIARAAALLREGRLVAFPTETVYGLGAHALDAEAVRRIFVAKGRPSYNPLIVHVPEAGAAREVAREWPDAAQRLALAFWPGPLTLVVPKREIVPDIVTAGLGSVAVRVPAHPVALALLRAARIPVAAPSANPFTRVSPTMAAHVERGLGERVDLVLDAGPTTVGIESTVLDVTGERPVLLRTGIISAEQVAAVVGPVGRPAPATDGEAPRPSPGMLDRHYAPRATVRLATDAGEVMRLTSEGVAAGRTVGAILHAPLATAAQHVVQLPEEPAAYARWLYATLHALDDAACDVIVVQAVPATPAWAGIRDRLERSAS